MIQKFPQIEGRNPATRPITILSIGHPDRWQRTIDRVIPPLLADPVAGQAVAYWLIEVPQDEEQGAYNACQSYNDALWECESPVVVFSTGDSMIMPQLLWRAYGVYLEAGIPVLTLRADETGECTGEARGNNHAIGDLMLMSREWAIEAGGWDERMICWGFADYALCLQMERNGHGPIVLGDRWQDRTIHLWHPTREESWYRLQNVKNRRIFHLEPPWTKADFLRTRDMVSADVA